MMLKNWLRPPRLILTLFLSLVAVCAAALAWLGWQFLIQDRALERQRAQESVEGAADRIVDVLELEVAKLDEAVRSPDSDPPSGPGVARLVSNGKSIRVEPAGSLLWYPWLPAPSTPDSRRFEAAEELEFRRHDLGRAAAAYRRLASSRDEAIRAEALVRLGRVLRRGGKPDEALAAYRALFALGNVQVAGMPAGLIARTASCAVMEEAGRRPEAEREALALHADLLGGRWPVTRAVFETCDHELARWLDGGKESGEQTGRIVLAEAAEVLWQEWRSGNLPESGRRLITLREDPALAVWRAERESLCALFAARQYLKAPCGRLGSEHRVSLALTDQEGRPIFGSIPKSFPVAVRPASATRMPWTVHIASGLPAEEAGPAATRRLLVMTGLAVFAVLLLAGSYFIARAMNREMAVAQLQSNFVAAVSHEFRTPLSALGQLSEMLAHGRIASADQRQSAYETMVAETKRLRRLVEGLLDFGRMETGKYQYRFERIDAASLARQVTSQFETSVRARGYQVSFITGLEAVPIRGDADALSRALWNLLDNAVKYSPESRAVTVELALRDKRLAVMVRDLGVGIPADEVKNVFDTFYRGSYAIRKGIKGTGIGLAMVREIVRAHGGEVQVESEPGKGSTCTLLLPMEDLK
jgi:signal transduction histidine kinase